MSSKVITQSIYTIRLSPVKDAPAQKSIRDHLYDRIVSSLTPMGKSSLGENLLLAEWKWKDTKEQFIFRHKDINDLVADILDEHPRCWDYRKAVIALMAAETGIVDPVSRMYRGPKPWRINPVEYHEVRDQMMDLSTPSGKHIFNAIINLGPNPTQGLGEDLDSSKWLATILINKLWRTKKDFTLNLTLECIKRNMISDLIKDPIKAMQCNTYVYSAMKEHCSISN